MHIGLRAGDDRRPARDEFVVKLDPSTGARLVVDAHRADGKGPQPVTLDVEFADEGGEGPTPYEVLLHAALVGDSSRFKGQDVVEECWRVMQPLIDNPPPVHPYAPGTWGPAIASTLVADHGGWQGPWIVEPGDGSLAGMRRKHARRTPTPANRGGRAVSPSSPFPPSPTTPSCRTATRVRWSRRTVRSTGCACPPSTRPARSGTSSTAAPGRSGSARTASTCPPSGRTFPGPTSSPRPGTRPAAGSWCTMPSRWGQRQGAGPRHAAHPAPGRR